MSNLVSQVEKLESIPVESGHLQALAFGALNAEVREHIREGMRKLTGGGLVEIRAKTERGIVAGYFDDFEKLAEAVQGVSEQLHATAVWWTINEPHPQCKARACNRFKPGIKTTTDRDIVRIRRLFMDFDPVRPSDVSATDQQVTTAVQRAKSALDVFRAAGWPEPVFSFSGNGAQLVWATDLPANDDLTKKLVKAWVEWAGKQWSGQGIEIDQSVFKPAQLARVPGTWNRKGDNTPEAPHRLSRVLEWPAGELVPVTADQLRGIVGDQGGEKTPTRPADPTPEAPSSQIVADAIAERKRLDGIERPGGFDLDQFLQDHEIEVAHKRRTEWHSNAGTEYHLKRCPFFEQHNRAFIFKADDGPIQYKCHGDSCKGHKWREFRSHFDPTCYDRKERPTPEGKPAGEKKPIRIRRWFDLKEIALAQQEKWIVTDLIEYGSLGIVSGLPYSGKTTLISELIASIATKRPFLGFEVKTRCPVVFVNADQTRERLLYKRIRRGMDELEELKLNDVWADLPLEDIPTTVTDEYIAELVKAVKAVLTEFSGETGIILIDTLRSAFLQEEDGGAENDATSMIRLLAPIRALARRTGWAVLILHHNTKAGNGPAGSAGILGNTDSAWNLTRDMASVICNVAITTRDGVIPAFDVKETLTGLVRLDKDSAKAEKSKAENEALEAKIRLFPDTAPEAWSIQDMVDAGIATGDTDARRFVEEAERAGVHPRLERTGTGKKGDPKRWFRV